MAIAFVASGAYAFSTGAASLSLAKPTGTASGNLLIAFVSVTDNAGGGSTVTPPSGWVNIIGPIKGAGAGSVTTLYAFYKVAGGSEPSTYTFASVAGSGQTPFGLDGHIRCYSYPTPFGSSTVINSTASTTGITATSVVVPALTETFVSGEWYVSCAVDLNNVFATTTTPTLSNLFTNGGQWNGYTTGDLIPGSSPGTESFNSGGGGGTYTTSAVGIGFTILAPTGGPVPVTQTYVLTSASTSPWIAPPFATQIALLELLGAGGNGAAGTASASGASGGSGCYGTASGIACTPGQSFSFSIAPAGTPAATWFSSSGTFSADFGRTASGTTAGVAGATANCIGLTATAGHIGLAGVASAGRPGAAGPGAPGPNGAGAAGGTLRSTSGAGGSGGGGANGGAAGAEAPNTAGGAGGAGGAGEGGSGGGTAGTSPRGTGGTGTSGTGGGGGGAGGNATASQTSGTGGIGADDTANSGWSGNGPGGGGGGGGGSSGTTSTGGTGGAAGSGGGGGGGGAGTTTGGGSGGHGGQGLIRLTVTTYPFVAFAPTKVYLRR